MGEVRRETFQLIERGLVSTEIASLWTSWQRGEREIGEWILRDKACVTQVSMGPNHSPPLLHVGHDSVLAQCTLIDWQHAVAGYAITPDAALERLARPGYANAAEGEPNFDMVWSDVKSDMGVLEIMYWRLILPIQSKGFRYLLQMSSLVKPIERSMQSTNSSLPEYSTKGSHQPQYSQEQSASGFQLEHCAHTQRAPANPAERSSLP